MNAMIDLGIRRRLLRTRAWSIAGKRSLYALRAPSGLFRAKRALLSIGPMGRAATAAKRLAGSLRAGSRLGRR